MCLVSPFHRLQVHSSHCLWCLPLVAKVGSVGCVGFLVGGTGPSVLVDEPRSVFLVDRTMSMSGGVFWGVCDLIMILGSLSANGWGCVPVLLVVWHRVSSTVSCCLLSGAGSSHWNGDLLESFPYLILCGARRSLVDQCPELGSPTSEAQAWHLARAPRPCQPHGFPSSYPPNRIHRGFARLWILMHQLLVLFSADQGNF